MAEDNKWKGWWFFFTNNMSFSTWLILFFIIACVVAFISYGHQQRQAGREETKGTTILQEGIVNPTPTERVKGAKDGMRNTILVNPKTGETAEVLSRKLLPTAIEKSHFKLIGAGGFDGLDVGVGYEIFDFNVPLAGNINIDFPIIMFKHWGGGISKDINDNFDLGAGVFEPYEVKNVQDAKDNLMFMIYGAIPIGN